MSEQKFLFRPFFVYLINLGTLKHSAENLKLLFKVGKQVKLKKPSSGQWGKDHNR